MADDADLRSKVADAVIERLARRIAWRDVSPAALALPVDTMARVTRFIEDTTAVSLAYVTAEIPEDEAISLIADPLAEYLDRVIHGVRGRRKGTPE